MGNALQGKTALIIGGAGGTGSGFARVFASEGAKIMVNDIGYAMMPESGDYDVTTRSPDEADRIVREIREAGGVAVADYEDAAQWDSSARTVEHCLREFGSVDIVVHASVVSRLGMVDELSDEDWDMVIRQNLYPNFYLTRHTLPHMKKNNYGRHIYIGSATIREMWDGANFAAATGARYSLMRSVALEVKDYNITSNCIEPWTQTKTGQRKEGQEMLKKRQEALGLPPPDIEDVDTGLPPGDTNAPLGVYLCTEQGRRFNGQYFSNRFGRICIYSVPTELRYIYKDMDRHGNWTVEELTDMMPRTLEGAAQPIWHPRV